MISVAELYKISSLKNVLDKYTVSQALMFKYLKTTTPVIGKLSWKIKYRQQNGWNCQKRVQNQHVKKYTIILCI
jgi:hypothetical protein